MTVNRRHFPQASWAWPQGGLDLLLRAVLVQDRDVALAAARQWFATQSIDQAGFAEHRLLMAVAARFGQALADLPEYPRLAGLQRMLWTKARMALREVQPPLARMVAAGIPVMMLKGAARLATNPQDQKARVSHDTDILVPPADFAAALSMLTAHGWQASTGESALCLAQRLPVTRAINLFHGHFGDIDLHQWGYAGARPRPVLEEGLWQNARAAQFFGIPVLVPSPQDRVALSLSSSARDAHAHSDWLVDCAQALLQDDIAPGPLYDLLDRADLTVEGQVALSYLRQGIGLPIPALPPPGARIGWPGRVAVLLQMKPRAEWTPLTRLARGIAKQIGKLQDRRATPRAWHPPWLRGRFKGPCDGQPKGNLPDLSCPVTVGSYPPGRYSVDISLAVDMPGVRRRVEVELNGAASHVTRLRARDLWRRKGWFRLRFAGSVHLDRAGPLLLEMRPSKTLRGASPAEIARYGLLPTRLLSISIHPLNNQT